MIFYLLAFPALPPFLRSLFGISSNVATDAGAAEFHFVGRWSPMVSLAILVAFGIWFGYWYSREGKRPNVLGKAGLLFLRLLAVASLLLILLEPSLRITHRQTQKASAILMADTSQSMGFKDPRLPQVRVQPLSSALREDPRALPRAEILRKLANAGGSSLLAAVKKKFVPHSYTFNSSAHPIADSKSDKFVAAVNEKEGISTQIGSALNRVADESAGQRIAGLLLMSDGGNNLGDDPVTAAARWKGSGVPVSVVGFGDPTPTRDVAITEALADQVVRKDSTAQVYVGLSHRGYPGRSVEVTLRRGAEVIGRKSVTLGMGDQKSTLAFQYVPKQAGAFTYSVEVTPLEGEITRENNRRQFLQRVISKKLKILYIEGEPRWEYRYLKNAILRDQQIEFSCILTRSTGLPGGEGNVPINGFPRTEAELFAFDIVILGDVPRATFNDLQLKAIRRFVEDRGSSLIVICGEKHTPYEYRGTVIEPLFPMSFSSTPEQVKTETPFHWELTDQGKLDPLLRMSEDSAENARIWQELPGMYWHVGMLRTKPGATALVVNSDRSNEYGKRVVLAVQPFGAGKCLMNTSDTTWRWRWRVGDRYFYRFWGQAIRAMTPEEKPGGNRWADISVDRAEHLLGERVSIHARMLDAFFRPVRQDRIQAELRGETGAPQQVTLRAIPGSPGLYAAEALPEQTGKFTITAASPGNPQQKGSATFLVQAIALEQQQPEMNESLLRKIAQAGGGKFYYPEELNKWVSTLKPNDLVITQETEIELWDAPIGLIFFVLPLTLEWFFRKRSGLL